MFGVEEQESEPERRGGGEGGRGGCKEARARGKAGRGGGRRGGEGRGLRVKSGGGASLCS